MVLFWSTLTKYKFAICIADQFWPVVTFEGLDLNTVQNGRVWGPSQARTTRMTLTKLAQVLENSWYNVFGFKEILFQEIATMGMIENVQLLLIFCCLTFVTITGPVATLAEVGQARLHW